MKFECLRSIAPSLAASLAFAISVAAAQTLTPYYTYYPVPGTLLEETKPTPTGFPPAVRVIGGGIDPPPFVNGTTLYPSIQRMLWAPWLPFVGVQTGMPVTERRTGTCTNASYGGATLTQLNASHQFTQVLRAEPPSVEGRCRTDFISGEPLKWMTTDLFTVLAPIRRTAIDGSQYDASPMLMQRGGFPWMTYYGGYRLGFVAGESNWLESHAAKLPELAGWPSFPNARDNFELVQLPPPFAEDDVVEYVNKQDFPKQPGGQFFYAVLASDKSALDAVPAWQRSGKTFRSGGYVSVCRFYGGKNGGPNTHFYSADDKECAALKAVPALAYEGQTFAVNMPMPGHHADGTKPCPAASKPLYRLYNNASAPGKDYVSNHRYVTERADVSVAVAQGWLDEGQVMCVPQ